MLTFESGQIIRGKYRLERVLGTGGMGVVIAARHLRLEEPVAIKLLHSWLAQRPDAIERFLREARAASRLTSDHVVRVFDVDLLESGAPFIVMEYLEDMDLRALLGERGPLPIGEAVSYVLDTCEAISEAHALGIVHRDLKPQNLFVARRRDGSVRLKVLDFGISKIVPTPGATGDGFITSTDVMLGSPLYMAPEQLGSPRAVDARVDIWALGVVLYQLLTARMPFEGGSFFETASATLQAGAGGLRCQGAQDPARMQLVFVRSPDVSPGKNVTFHVWLPASSRIVSVQPYLLMKDGLWEGDYRFMSNLDGDAWNEFTVRYRSGSPPIEQLGVEFVIDPSAAWSGVCYIDSVGW
ncbi:serine/threonine-protein kinase [Sorangium sp. So ce834]|uniref:serine/threonine-protein kinase n=1 Tax=Sorangium sp. So ce834 TaxID=3133321 RepID=UPI003F6382BE